MNLRRLAFPGSLCFVVALAAAQTQALVPEGFGGRPVHTEKQFVGEWAREYGWADAEETLRSYVRTVRSLTDRKLGEFQLCTLSNPGLPGGGEKTFVLFCRKGRNLTVFTPLATQMPSGSQSGEALSLRTMQWQKGGSGTILWITIGERIQENLRGGESVVTSDRLLGYAFSPGPDSVRCIAYAVPLKSSTSSGGLRNQSMLTVTFPQPGRLAIRKSTPTVTPEQQRWIGEYKTED